MQKSQLFNTRDNLIGPDSDLYYKKLSGALNLDEPNLAFVVKNYLARDAIYFDIGANVGETAIPIAKYLSHGSVYAFEPSSCFSYMEANVKMSSLKNIKLFKKALGAKEGEINFINENPLAYSHCSVDCSLGGYSERIRIFKIDNIVKNEKISRLNFIKIKVIGYEKEVIKGCELVIKKFNPLFYIEFNSWNLIKYRNESPRDFLYFLYEKFLYLYWVRNYIVRRLESEKDLIEFLEANIMQNGCRDNLICSNRAIETFKVSEYLFYGKNLPTEIGMIKGDSIVNLENVSGCLNYGPYVRLVEGKYKVKINLRTSSQLSEEVGCWEVYISQFDLILKTGKIMNSIGGEYKIEANFEITEEMNESLIEVKTYAHGNGSIELLSIVIETLTI
ncbi:MAG: hypothetical protein C5B43_02510 [Verrucomicrobia bacterium]|nr:MAG: hypothetical protein C5B43_02510 [Verrucomicrobiota bacterium]